MDAVVSCKFLPHHQHKLPPMSGKDPTTGGATTEAEATAEGKGDNLQTTVDLSQYVEDHSKDSNKDVPSFAIVAHEQNTEHRPDHESTNLVPALVRRVNSEEILPRPFKTTNQLLAVSYLSVLCCLCCAVYAVDNAWEVKVKRNAGLYSSAIKNGHSACCLLVAALVTGTLLWIVGIVFIILELQKDD